MTKSLAVLGLVLVLSTSMSGARSPGSQAKSSLEDVLEYGRIVNDAAIAGDGKLLSAARLNMPSMLALSVDDADQMLVYYTAAYASWEFSLQTQDTDEARGALYDAAAQLRHAIGYNKPFSEGVVLLAIVHAQLLKLSAGSVPYDPSVGGALIKAQAIERSNPRVALAMGIVAFLAPVAFGAGIGDAEAELKRAETLFAAEPPNKSWPNWGRPQVEAWLGQILAKKGDSIGARQAYQRALTIEPGYAWVRDTLLPTLSK